MQVHPGTSPLPGQLELLAQIGLKEIEDSPLSKA
jgi:hypothetical protein